MWTTFRLINKSLHSTLPGLGMIPPLKLIFVSVPKFYPQIAQNLPFIFSENMPQFKTIVAPKVATTVSTLNGFFQSSPKSSQIFGLPLFNKCSQRPLQNSPIW